MRLGLRHHGDPNWFYNQPRETQAAVLAVLRRERGGSQHAPKSSPSIPYTDHGSHIKIRAGAGQASFRFRQRLRKQGMSDLAIETLMQFARTPRG